MRLTLLFPLLAACATAPEVQGPAPQPPEERSSLDVLLRNQGELNLTAKQVEIIEAADSRRETEARTVRDQLHAQRGQEIDPNAPNPSGMGFGGNMNPNMSGNPNGAPPQPGMGRRQKGPSEQERLEQALEQLDTMSFLEVSERVLTAEQRPRAEKLATDYRTRLYDFRQAMKKRRR